jgi:hypothetical protein
MIGPEEAIACECVVSHLSSHCEKTVANLRKLSGIPGSSLLKLAVVDLPGLALLFPVGLAKKSVEIYRLIGQS